MPPQTDFSVNISIPGSHYCGRGAIAPVESLRRRVTCRIVMQRQRTNHQLARDFRCGDSSLRSWLRRPANIADKSGDMQSPLACGEYAACRFRPEVP